MTMSRAVRPATAPYSLGPRTRAHTIWKPYVATFITAMATAMPALPRSRPRRPPGICAERCVVVVTRRA